MPRVAIGLGLGLFPFKDMASFWRWVDLCEAGGVDSLWQSDRLVTQAPMLESMSVMGALAGRTCRIKFGMTISVGFRDPVLLAKQCASIDVLSNGRLLPVFGIGDAEAPEWRAMNIDPKTRGARADEALEIIRRLWTEDHVTFEGKHYVVRDASIAPKPVQAELPMWIGGSSEAAIKRVARIGTGWQSSGEPPSEIGALIDAIRVASAAAGRSIDPGHYGAGLPFYFGKESDPVIERAIAAYSQRAKGRDLRARMAVGDAASLVERIKAFVAAGATKFILFPMAHGDEEILAQTKRLIEEVLPEVEKLSS